MAVRKPKAALPEVPVPQSDDEASALLAEFGATFNTLARSGVALNDELALVKLKYETEAKPLQAKLSAIEKALAAFGAANRRRLTDGGKTKTVKLAAGEMGWRVNPPSVHLKRGFKVEDVIADIRRLRLNKFLRPAVALNKQAMLDDPERAETVDGIKIVKDVEEFFVAPFGAELAEVKA